MRGGRAARTLHAVPSPALDVLVAGHPCHDLLRLPGGREVHALGGAAAYASAVLQAAGVEYAVAAGVGEDFRYAQALPWAPRVVRGARTTCFEADLTGAERVLRLTAVTPALAPADVDAPARVALACAVAGELPAATLAHLCARSGHVLADAQGLLRATEADGRVVNRPLEATPYAALVDRLHVLKASEEEARLLDVAAVRRRTVLVVTRGARGCTVLTADAEHHVPAVPAVEVDPTGAGDCFLAGLALGVLRGLPLVVAAEAACALGAQAVAHVGVPPGFTLPAVLQGRRSS